MSPNTMRTLAEYIHELRCRDRHYNGADSQPAFDTTVEDDSHWGQGDRGRDERRSQDHSG